MSWWVQYSATSMGVRGIIDTGAILALLDTDDTWHEPCREAFAAMRLPLATTAAVMAELFHLLVRRRQDVGAACLDWRFDLTSANSETTAHRLQAAPPHLRA